MSCFELFQEKKKIKERSGSRDQKDPDQPKEQESRRKDGEKEHHRDKERSDKHHRSEQDPHAKERDKDKSRDRERDKDKDKGRAKDRDREKDSEEIASRKQRPAATSGTKRELGLDIKYAQPAAPEHPLRLPASSNVR